MDTGLRQYLTEKLSQFFNQTILILNCQPVSGGDINEAFLVNTSAGQLFMKMNSHLDGADLFEKESLGLEILAKANALKVPTPLFRGSVGEQQFLVMEYIEKGKPLKNFWIEFGRSMAQLHHQSQSQFGLTHNNFIGSLRQSNRQSSTWSEFYSQERILPLTRIAFEKGLLANNHLRFAEQLCMKINTIVPQENPSLLHGDLWNGNFMVAASGLPAIFDPAVYYGHREIDLAMTKLFGGFDPEFYQAYDTFNPIDPGWKHRIDIFQLYPLLVHLLLFGGHYRENVVSILTKYK